MYKSQQLATANRRVTRPIHGNRKQLVDLCEEQPRDRGTCGKCCLKVHDVVHRCPANYDTADYALPPGAAPRLMRTTPVLSLLSGSVCARLAVVGMFLQFQH